MKQICYIAILFFMGELSLTAQQQVELETSEYKSKIDTNYIQTFEDELMVRFIVDHKFTSIDISSIDTLSLVYRTNNSWTQGIGFAYKWLALDVSVRMPWAKANPTKGLTKNTSIGLGINGGKFWTRVFYEKNQGYYLENIESWDQDYFLSHDNYPYRKDLTSTVFYASVNYGFNARKYSNKANMTQQDRQMKGAGSFTAGLAYSRSDISANYSLVPVEYSNLFSDTASAGKQYSVTATGINFGYLRNIPLSRNKKWSISLVLIPGLSLQKVTVVTQENNVFNSDLVLGGQLEGRLSLGYNGDLWYYGAMFRTYGLTNSYIESSPISQSYNYSRFYLGYKFPVKETNSKLLKKLKF